VSVRARNQGIARFLTERPRGVVQPDYATSADRSHQRARLAA